MKQPCIDIFGVPEPATREARLSSWNYLCSRVSALNIQNCQVSFSELYIFVLEGFVSPRSASYFLTGRISLSQFLKYEAFAQFWDNCVNNHVLSSFKVFQLWQKKQKCVETENTFLFPLVELDCDSGFESERSEFSDLDYHELVNLRFEEM